MGEPLPLAPQKVHRPEYELFYLTSFIYVVYLVMMLNFILFLQTHLIFSKWQLMKLVTPWDCPIPSTARL